MKRLMFLLFASLLFISVGVAQNKGATISAQKTEHDFGKIKEVDGLVSYVFKIKNTGSKPLVLSRVVASCGCTTPEYSQEPIAPGAEGEIKIVFNPAGRLGQFVKTIAVYSNGMDGAYILRIKGEVI